MNQALLEKMLSLILRSAEERKIKKAIFSKPSDTSILKVVFTLKSNRDGLLLQGETFHKDNKVTHKNYPLDSSREELVRWASDFSQINLITTEGECEYRVSSSGKVALLGADKLERKLRSATSSPTESVTPLSNNREKQYILNGSEPFLQLLGVADKNGRVYDRKQAKFRQINRFLEPSCDNVDWRHHGKQI